MSSALLWITLTYYITKYDETVIAMDTYMHCVAGGVHDDLDCEYYRKEFEDISDEGLWVAHLIIVAFLNVSNLPLIIEYRSIKEFIVSALSHSAVKGNESHTITPHLATQLAI